MTAKGSFVLSPKAWALTLLGHLALLSLHHQPANALLVNGFSGPFAAANWTTSAAASLDATAGPSSFTLSGTEDGSGLESFFSISIPLSVDQDTIAVSWNYSTNDLSPASDDFGFLVNGADFVNLSDPFGATNQSGSAWLALNSTDTLWFAIRSADNLGGTASVVLYGFRAGLRSEVPKCPCPTPSVPVPAAGPIVLFGSLAGFWQARRVMGRPRPQNNRHTPTLAG